MEKRFDEMTETEKQEFLSKTMEQCRKDYKEEPISSDDVALKRLAEALKTKGFNFDPFKIIKEIDAEAEAQFKKIFKDLFSGLGPNRLADIKNEIIKWYNDEEARFNAFRDNYLDTAKGPAQMELGSTPAFVQPDAHEELPEVVSIKSAKPKSKGKK